MALYNDLPVFKATYQLLLTIVSMSISWQRDYRYTLGQELKEALMQLLAAIYSANGTKAKQAPIGEGRKLAERIKIYIRLLHDLRQIGDRQYLTLAEQTDSISKQLSRWYASSMGSVTSGQ